jgi:hypothetical protein
LLIVAFPSLGSTQTAQNVEVDPVTCWWRATVAAVRVGEPFSVLLTCSALETDAARAVIDRSRLGAAAVQFPPYEVVSGSETADYLTTGRRFMQYEYSLRLIAEDAFGADVPISGMEVAYRLESHVEQDASVQGREQTYQLPALPMRVTSLVPDNATHIRELSVPTLGEIAAREFRGRMLRIVALILFAVAGLTLVVATVRWARQGKTGTVVAARPLLANRAVLAGARRELRTLQQETRGAGWNAETVSRALAAARIVASYLSGSPVVQRSSVDTSSPGALMLHAGWPSKRRVAVSGSVTTQEAGSALALDPTSADLNTAIGRLTTARYGRSPSYEAAPLDDALDSVMRAADRAAARHTRVAEAVSSMRQSMRAWRPRAWAR